MTASALVCVIVEHQSDPDPLMALRMLLDAVLYWERQWLEHQRTEPPRPPLALRPVVPIVFYTGSKGWRTVRSLRGLLAEPKLFHQFIPDWTPVFWNLSDESPDDLLNSGDARLQAMAVVRSENANLDEFRQVFVDSASGLNDSAADETQWHQLMRLILTWAAHRRPRDELDELWKLAEQTAISPRHKREVRVMAQTAVESWVEEGKAEGIAIGKAEGKAETLRETLFTLGEQQYGKPGRKQRAELQAITDIGRLVRMRDALLQVDSWRELLAIL